MADDSSPALGELLDRIVAPEPRTVDLPDDLTGELGRLASWWRGLSDGHPRDATTVVPHVPGRSPEDALLIGVADADRAIDGGGSLLIPRVEQRHDVAARAVIGLLTRREASAVLGQPEGMTDRDWMAACALVRDAMAGAAEHRGQPLALLDRLGASDIAAAAGVLLGAAARRTPCLVDGTDELAAALVADRLCYRARGWWRAGTDSPDPGRAAAAARADLAPGLPLALTDDSCRGADATLALLAWLSG